MAPPINKRLAIWLGVGLCVLVVPLAFMFCSRQSDNTADEDGGRWSFGTSNQTDRLQILKLSGMIVDPASDSIFASVNNIDSLKKRLRKAAKNERIKGILLRIDSPGGTVASSQEIHGLVASVRKKGKPVVVSISDVAASGGYYVASACDWIVAEPGSITGSIGVIMNLFNLQGLEQKLGIAPQVIKSGPYKDIASPNRPLTPEEKVILQAIIQDSYDQFVDAVAQGRKMDRQSVLKLADGRIYTGRQALKLGLIDELGDQDAALLKLQALARQRYQLTRDLKVEEGQRAGLLSELLQMAESRAPATGLISTLMGQLSAPYLHKIPLWLLQ